MMGQIVRFTPKSTYPEDIQWASPGETRQPTYEEISLIMPELYRCVPVRSWSAEFWDGVPSAVVFVALGAVGGIIVTVLTVLRIVAVAQ